MVIDTKKESNHLVGKGETILLAKRIGFFAGCAALLIIAVFVLYSFEPEYVQISPTAHFDCPLELVCGEDGITYASVCDAENAGIAIVHTGGCLQSARFVNSYVSVRTEAGKTSVVCSDDLQATCGLDGKTHKNPCFAALANTGVAYIGECSDTSAYIIGTECNSAREFVCAYPGTTYQNACLAMHHGAQILYSGVCKTCANSVPVCGVNGITYADECSAKEHLVAIAYTGKCEIR